MRLITCEGDLRLFITIYFYNLMKRISELHELVMDIYILLLDMPSR